MAGDPGNATVWANADVFIGDLASVNPADGVDFGADWDAVGLLSGDDGFSESMANDSNDFFAWGGILIATTRTNFKLTRQFTAYEDNETVMDLVYPGSDLTFDGDGGYTGALGVPDLTAKFKIGFRTQTGDQVKTVISRRYAQVEERGDSQESETSLAMRQLTVSIYPGLDETTGKYVLFDTYKGPIVIVP